MALAWKNQIHFELAEREIYLKSRLVFLNLTMVKSSLDWDWCINIKYKKNKICAFCGWGKGFMAQEYFQGLCYDGIGAGAELIQR